MLYWRAWKKRDPLKFRGNNPKIDCLKQGFDMGYILTGVQHYLPVTFFIYHFLPNNEIPRDVR